MNTLNNPIIIYLYQTFTFLFSIFPTAYMNRKIIYFEQMKNALKAQSVQFKKSNKICIQNSREVSAAL